MRNHNANVREAAGLFNINVNVNVNNVREEAWRPQYLTLTILRITGRGSGLGAAPFDEKDSCAAAGIFRAPGIPAAAQEFLLMFTPGRGDATDRFDPSPPCRRGLLARAQEASGGPGGPRRPRRPQEARRP